MIGDATIEVTCDHESCEESIVIEPEYVFNDYSGKSGHYDTSKRALRRLIEEQEGWFMDADECTTYCGQHTPDDGHESDGED
jgi:hypothetical protein